MPMKIGNHTLIRKLISPLSGVTLMTCLLPHPAFGLIEEVVVTAQKRSENMQDVPISITALNASLLEQSGISGTSDLSLVTPGLHMSRALSGSTPFIRGVGTLNTGTGDESPVATYVDGVYQIQFESGIMDFNNIERVEVLKGPQGTLFGRNTTGGVIHVITKEPEFETSAKLGVSYGNYETIGANYYGTTGLSEILAADIAFYYSDQNEGYGDNITTLEDVNKEEKIAVRNSWLLEPGEYTKARLTFDYSDSESSLGFARHPAEGAIGLNGLPFTAGFHDDQSDFDSGGEYRQWGAALKVNHSLDNVDLVSITAYRDMNLEFTIDQDSTPLFIQHISLEAETDFFSQEFQILSSIGDNFEWIAGLYYMMSESSYEPFTANSPVATGAVRPNQDSTSIAVFGQGSYNFTDSTKLTIGLRWTEDEREFTVPAADFATGALAFLPMVLPFEDEESWSEVTWRISLDQQFTDSVMGYISYNKGFKSGVFNTVGVLANQFVEPVDPETVDAYEVGVKSNLLENRLQANLAIFFNDIEDRQEQIVLGPGATTLINASEAEVWGAELDLIAQLTDDFRMQAGISYMDSEYTSFPGGFDLSPNPAGGNDVTFPANLEGRELPHTPEFTINVGGYYTVPLGDSNLDIAVNYFHNDGFFWGISNVLPEDSYDIVNAEISLSSDDESWKYSLWGKNLTDEEYAIFGTESSSGNNVAAAPPLTFGVTAELSIN